MNTALKTLNQMLKTISVCYISSITEEGYPKTRAMLLPVKTEDNVFYFHTNTASAKTGQFKKNPKACVYFCRPQAFEGLVFMGTMEILEDEQTRNSFWKEGYEMYYPLGLSDFSVMKFTALNGDFYENFSVTNFEVQ